jgi:hypothetical protein
VRFTCTRSAAILEPCKSDHLHGAGVCINESLAAASTCCISDLSFLAAAAAGQFAQLAKAVGDCGQGCMITMSEDTYALLHPEAAEEVMTLHCGEFQTPTCPSVHIYQVRLHCSHNLIEHVAMAVSLETYHLTISTRRSANLVCHDIHSVTRAWHNDAHAHTLRDFTCS